MQTEYSILNKSISFFYDT